MPDTWELAYGLDPSDPTDASEDSDGDGVSNVQEYLAGTDPKDAMSSLRLLAMRPRGSSIELKFNSIAGRTYVQPSRPIGAKQFDVTNPAAIRDAYELGLKDGKAFAADA